MKAGEKAALIAELETAARWYAARKISHEGKRSKAYWMAPDEGDPAPPDLSNDGIQWIQKHRVRFQALVAKTRKELGLDQATQ